MVHFTGMSVNTFFFRMFSFNEKRVAEISSLILRSNWNLSEIGFEAAIYNFALTSDEQAKKK